MRKRNLIMLEEAQERLSKIKMKEETETVWVTEALGRVCAEHIYAVMDQPPFAVPIGWLRGQKPGYGRSIRGESRKAECNRAYLRRYVS